MPLGSQSGTILILGARGVGVEDRPGRSLGLAVGEIVSHEEVLAARKIRHGVDVVGRVGGNCFVCCLVGERVGGGGDNFALWI